MEKNKAKHRMAVIFLNSKLAPKRNFGFAKFEFLTYDLRVTTYDLQSGGSLAIALGT